jgi:hypothetical protein
VEQLYLLLLLLLLWVLVQQSVKEDEKGQQIMPTVSRWRNWLLLTFNSSPEKIAGD